MNVWVTSVSSIWSVSVSFLALMFVPHLNQGPQTSLPDVTVQKFPSLIKARQINSTLWTFPPLALRSAPGNRKLTCNRESEKERQRERESSVNEEYSVLPPPHSHRDLAWAGVSPWSGWLKYKPLSSQTLIPTRNTLLIPRCDPSEFYYCKGENGWQGSSYQRAAEQYRIVATQLHSTEEGNSSWNHSVAAHNYDPVFSVPCANTEYMDTQTQDGTVD